MCILVIDEVQKNTQKSLMARFTFKITNFIMLFLILQEIYQE